MRGDGMLIGNRLKQLRKQMGLSQTELGNLIGIGKSSISCYEKEIRNPNIEVLLDLVQLFGVSADYLLGTDNLIKSTDKKGKERFIPITEEELVFLEELKKNKEVYDILLEDPKRGSDIVKNWLN